MAGKISVKTGLDGAFRLFETIGVGHRHEVEPQAFEEGVEAAGDVPRLVAIAAGRDNSGAEIENDR